MSKFFFRFGSIQLLNDAKNRLRTIRGRGRGEEAEREERRKGEGKEGGGRVVGRREGKGDLRVSGGVRVRVQSEGNGEGMKEGKE